MSGRGRGGKFNKAKRGGGKKFSRDLQPLDKEGNPLGMWRDPKEPIAEESSSEEESSEDESDDGGLGSSKIPESEMTREQRREAAKVKKQAAIARKNKKVAEVGDMPTDSEEDSDEDEDEDMPANPNHTAKARNQARAAPPVPTTDAPPKKPVDKENLSRREREALQAQQAKERYQKMHAEGKTDEAKADLARLKLVKEQREAAAARKQAEREEEDARADANKEKLDKERAKRDAALGPTASKKAVRGGKK